MRGTTSSMATTRDFELDGNDDGVFILRVVQGKTMPGDLAVALGEWLYNLRASLDYVIWATACYVAGQMPPPDEGVLQYPIYDQEAAWKRNDYRLKGLHQHQREMLLTMQPFNNDSDANYLGWLNRLARIDRHRTLVNGIARLATIEPVLQVPDGSKVAMEWGEQLIVDGHADVARITVTPYAPGMDVKVNPRAGIDPEIGEWSGSPFWSRLPFDERLKMTQLFVAGEIAVYEYDRTGRGPKAHLVSEHFRTESDMRRDSASPPTQRRPEVVWKSVKPGTASTRQRFEGLDFPNQGSGRRISSSRNPAGESEATRGGAA
jgi:hypothetical protein